MGYLAEEFRGEGLTRITSIYVGGTVMGGFSGRFLTGHTGQIFGWRGSFLTLAALNFCGALLVLWRLPASRHFVANRDLRGAFQTLGRHLRNQRMLAACAVGFCVLFSLVGTFTYVNLLLVKAPFNLTVAGLANVFCVYLLGVVVTPLGCRFIGRLGFLRSLLCAITMSSLGLLLTLTLTPTLAIVIFGLAVCSSGVFLCQSATISFIASHVSEGRSLANGIYYMAYYAGVAAGSWLAGLAYEGWDWNGAVASMIMVQVLAALLAWVGWKQGASPAAPAS